VEAPEGTEALPVNPFSKEISALTVGFPLESMISLPMGSMMIGMVQILL